MFDRIFIWINQQVNNRVYVLVSYYECIVIIMYLKIDHRANCNLGENLSIQSSKVQKKLAYLV